MDENKTKATPASVETFIKGITDEKKRKDSLTILQLMREVTGEEPVMWGDSIVGFGQYHYKYATGREGDWMKVGFSPRKQNLTLYLTYWTPKHEELLKVLGKHKIGKACLYINRLEDVDLEVLSKLVSLSCVKLNADGTPVV